MGNCASGNCANQIDAESLLGVVALSTECPATPRFKRKQIHRTRSCYTIDSLFEFKTFDQT